MKSKTKCWMIGHDWEVIKSIAGDYIFPVEIKVCLRCETVLDAIAPYRAAKDREAWARRSRGDRAKKIYDERHSKC